MIKRTITSENPFTGEMETKDYHFHLSKADLIRILGRAKTDDWEAYVNEIVSTGDTDKILNFIESIVRDAVGIRTPEGLFIKPKEYAEAFIASDAYGELIIEFLKNNELAKDFFTKVVGNVGGENKNNITAIANKKGNKHKKHNK